MNQVTVRHPVFTTPALRREFKKRLRELYPSDNCRDSLREVIALDYLKKKLGKSSFVLWETLYRLRDDNRDVSLTREQMSSSSGLSLPTVSRSLVKLTKLQMLGEPRLVARRGAKRTVVGKVNYSRNTVTLGKRTLAKILAANTHGGDRVSKDCKLKDTIDDARRYTEPKKESRVIRNSGDSFIFGKQDAHVGTDKSDLENDDQLSFVFGASRVGTEQVAQDDSTNSNYLVEEYSFLKKRIVGQDGLDSDNLSGSAAALRACPSGDGCASPEPPSLKPPAVGQADMSKQVLNQVGALEMSTEEQPEPFDGEFPIRQGNDAYARPVPGAIIKGEGIPKYPGSSVIPIPRLPNPPTVKKEMTDVQKVEFLIKAFRDVVKHKFNKTCYDMRCKPGTLTKHKNYKSLLKSAEYLEERSLSPYVWVMWELNRIEDYKAKLKAEGKKVAPSRSKNPWPPIYIIFAMKTLQKRSGWCRAESREFTGGPLTFSQEHRELISRWQLMRADLIRTQPESQSCIDEVVNKWFPNNLYEKLKSEAIHKAKQQTEKWEQDVRSGKFIWDYLI